MGDLCHPPSSTQWRARYPDLAPPGQERAQPVVAKIESAPDKKGEVDAEEGRAEKRVLDADLAGDGPSQESGEKNCAQHGGARNDIQDRADEADDPERRDDIDRIADFLG